MTTTTTDLITGLRKWTTNHDDHVRAAVELLIAHDYWLRNSRFTRAAVTQAQDGPYIAWSRARVAFDSGEFNRSSTSELAVLDLAITLGENRFKLSHMGTHNSMLIADAVATAVGAR